MRATAKEHLSIYLQFPPCPCLSVCSPGPCESIPTQVTPRTPTSFFQPHPCPRVQSTLATIGFTVYGLSSLPRSPRDSRVGVSSEPPSHQHTAARDRLRGCRCSPRLSTRWHHEPFLSLLIPIKNTLSSIQGIINKYQGEQSFCHHMKVDV